MEIEIAEGVAVDAQTVMTGRGCIIGQSGSGKSYLIGVIAEELCRKGLPFIIIDNEGEYASLKNGFRIMHIGDDPSADLDLESDYGRIFHESIKNGIPVLLDLSEVIDKRERAYRALKELYSVEEAEKKPYLVIIEEADVFAPQVVHPQTNIVEEISVRGRKRGIGMLVATQRPASISKNVLAQCSYGFIGKLSLDRDIKAVRTMFESKKQLDAIPFLAQGAFMPFGLQAKEEVRVRKSEMPPRGRTPQVEGRSSMDVDLQKVMGEIRKSLARIPPTEQAPARGHIIDARVLRYQFTLEDAREHAARIARKQFVFFGPTVESMESLEQMYIQVALCLIRVPTGRKNEYMDHYAMFRDNDMVEAKARISFVKPQITKPVAVSRYERAIMSVLSKELSLPRPLWQVADLTGMKEETVLRYIARLKRVGLVAEKGGNYSSVSYKWRLLLSQPQTVSTKIDTRKIVNYSPEQPKSLPTLLVDLFPDCDSEVLDMVYIPVYKITLRSGNKVRVFTIDGIYGNEV